MIFSISGVKRSQSGSSNLKFQSCVVLDDPNTIVFGSEPIRHEDKVVGWVTSGGYGYSINKSIAYAYLPIELAKAGRRLSVECFGVQILAEVQKEPLYDPKGEKIKT